MLISDPDLQMLLQETESGKLSGTSITKRCEILRDLKQAIDERCPDGAKTHNTLVPAGYLGRELNALKTAAESLKFSPAWIARCDQVLNNHTQLLLREYPPSQMKDLWPTLDTGARLDILRKLADQQCGLFANDGLEFSAPPINTDELFHGNIGGFSFQPCIHPVAHFSEIIFDEKFLRTLPNFNDAIGMIWHEQLHSLHYQLGCAQETLPANHPYAADAALMMDKILLGAHLTPRYGTLAYRADVEETLCMKTQSTLTTYYETLSRPYLQTLAHPPAPFGPR